MPNYQLGKIYMIKGKTSNLCYIGSTVQTLQKRLNAHKSTKFNKNRCCSNIIINSGEPYEIKLLELYPCNSKIELLKRERMWFDLFPNINKKGPYRYLEEKKESKKIYYQKNKDTYIENYKKNRKHLNELENSRRRFQRTEFGKLCKLYNLFKS